jgi:hypothetical protein
VGKNLIIAILCLFAASVSAAAQDARTYVPVNARTLAPVLVAQQRAVWDAMPQPWTLAGLVEQESCVSLTSKRCWDAHAELKTSREYGFGLGQITIAYRANGSVRFNKFQELVAAHPELSDWTWDERFDPDEQLKAIVLMCRTIYWRIAPAATAEAHLAFMLSGYNGGVSGVAQDRILCSHTDGCDPGLWFGNVANTSLKSKAPQREYGGQSFFSINRGYVTNVMTVRRDKYRPFWGVTP